MLVANTIPVEGLMDREYHRVAFALGNLISYLLSSPFIENYIFHSYNHYVEVVEPAGSQACIKCCDDLADCPTNMGMYIAIHIFFFFTDARVGT
jgi:hypothetical protein